MPRLGVAWVLLLAALSPALAHDSLYGFINCYHGHCPQDTLVFGIISSTDAEAYTVHVQKVLRSRGGLGSGDVVRLARGGWQDPLNSGRQPKAGRAVLVSFLRRGRPPYRPRYLVLSTTTDWRKMTVDANWYGENMAELQRFVRSGGQDDDFLSDQDGGYLRHRDGTVERIYSPTELRRPPKPPKSPAPRPRPALPAAAASTGVALLALAVLMVDLRRRRRPGATR